MEISIDKRPNAVIVGVKGRMDAMSAPAFESIMADHISTGASFFVVDCSAVEYISSAGLCSLLTTAKTLQGCGGELVLAAFRDEVREIFDIAGFGIIFSVFDSTEAALEQRMKQPDT
jgi:anti-anti-sigma factor